MTGNIPETSTEGSKEKKIYEKEDFGPSESPASSQKGKHKPALGKLPLKSGQGTSATTKIKGGLA